VEVIQDKKLKVGQAKQSQKTEIAIEEVDTCRDHIRRNKEDALFSVAGNFLFSQVELEFETKAAATGHSRAW